MKARKLFPRSLLDLVWSAFGGTVALGLALYLIDSPHSTFLLASLGGSTVFLFALTEAEAAQPRALFGGHLSGALIGIACYQTFGDAEWVLVLSVVLTMVFMKSARAIHPPAGANPLIMVSSHAGWTALANPVGLGVVVLFLAAVAWSRLKRGNSYPTRWW